MHKKINIKELRQEFYIAAAKMPAIIENVCNVMLALNSSTILPPLLIDLTYSV